MLLTDRWIHWEQHPLSDFPNVLDIIINFYEVLIHKVTKFMDIKKPQLVKVEAFA